MFIDHRALKISWIGIVWVGSIWMGKCQVGNKHGKSITEGVVKEGEKQIDRRKRKEVTQLKIRFNCSEKFS